LFAAATVNRSITNYDDDDDDDDQPLISRTVNFTHTTSV